MLGWFADSVFAEMINRFLAGSSQRHSAFFLGTECVPYITSSYIHGMEAGTYVPASRFHCFAKLPERFNGGRKRKLHLSHW